MCGITAAIQIENHKEIVATALEVMQNRGSDNTTIISKENLSIGHNLHAIVGYEPQPFETEEYIFATNCEIYNWEELKEKYNINAKNDAELFSKLYHKNPSTECLNELDGVYAFIYYNKKNQTTTIGRDILGIKPLFYSKQEGFIITSEKKTLVKQGITQIKELNPRQLLTYSTKTKDITIIQRNFFEIEPEYTDTYEILKQLTAEKLEKAILKRVPQVKFGVLFSGGIDSTIIAFILKKHNIDFTCYTAAVQGIGEDATDLIYAKKIAKDLELNLKINTITLDELEPHVKKVCQLIESNNVTKVGVALPFHVACEQAYKDGCRVIFSGLGSEEIFAGYERHAVSAGIGNQGYDKPDGYEKLELGNVNKECLSGLRQIHERDLYRDDVITMYHQIELRLPFFDKDLVSFALKIHPQYKISATEKKIILRDVCEDMGLQSEYARRPKKAAQYGSKFDKALQKLTKKKGFARRSEYLAQFFTEPNLKLGALLSTGKDSLYATYVMKQRNYNVACFMTMQSENTDSYMFHTPQIQLAKLQAEAANIPLITQITKGEKEAEIEDLKALLLKAKNEYQIDGVVTGALFSNYQRDRIEKACDELGFTCWNPLWHKNQEEYMYELLDNNFSFIMSKVMAEGLDKSWVGKIITKEDVDKLVALNKKVGINVAGEGGEFETFVLDCPLFSKKLELKDFELISDVEREETVTIDIKKIDIKDK